MDYTLKQTNLKKESKFVANPRVMIQEFHYVEIKALSDVSWYKVSIFCFGSQWIQGFSEIDFFHRILQVKIAFYLNLSM